MELEEGCPYCKAYKDGIEFKKVLQLESAGLVIYRHITPENSVDSVSQPEKDNAFIIHNTKNKNVSTSNHMSEFEQDISCPRCRYIVKHTKDLLLNVPFIRQKDVIGICDHCRFKKRIIERCDKCREVVEQFIKKKELKQTEIFDTDKQENVLISKVKDILKNVPTAVQIRKLKKQTRPETSLKHLSLGYTSPTYHVPHFKDMFASPKKTNKTNQLFKKGFFKQFETAKLYKNKSESDITFIHAKKRQYSEPRKYILFNSTENIAWSESSKESAELIALDKHQHKLTQKIKSKIEVDLTLKRPSSTELRLRSATMTEYENSTTDYLQSKKQISGRADYGPQLGPSEKQSAHERENIKNKKKYQLSYDNIHHLQYNKEDSKSLPKSEDIILRGIRKQTRSVYNIRQYSSEETLLRSASAITEDKLQKDFSYFFIKETNVVKKPSRKRVSSSELIKDTQDMYRARAEEERIKKELELKQKLEAEEKNRLAKSEKKKHLEEERRLEELRKKMAENEIKKSKKIEDEQNVTKKILKLETDTQKKSVKTSKEPSEKSRNIKIKTEIKDSKIDKSIKSDRDSVKSKKEIDKQEKAELMRLEKERKLQEKLEKEEQMRKAKEEKQRQNEERERVRAKMEEEMRKAKEEKQRQKEEKERDIAKKEEQLNMAKEQKQREKDERQKEKEQNRRQKEENKEESKPNKLEQLLLAEQIKQKDKESKVRKKQEDEAKKQEAQIKLKSLKETTEVQPEKQQSKKIIEEPKIKELNINQVKIRKTSPDDLILQLVKLKQTQIRAKERPTRISQIGIPNKTVYAHKGHQNKKTDGCIICLDSDLELDIENIVLNETKQDETHDIIIGQKIFKFKPSLVTKKEEKEKGPLFFSSIHTEDENIIKTQKVIEHIIEENERKPPILSTKYVDQEVPKGVIRYALSDRSFIEKGWTMLPTEKVVRKMNVYRMRPAHPEFDWFEHNKSRKLICYDTGEKLAEFDDNGKGRWFYRSGRVALDYYDAEEINAQQRIIIFSSGEPDERGCSRPFAILASFDYLGNGIVFDHSGKIRLKYNQTEGVVLDRAIGPVSHWKWHTLNDPPVLQQVMIDTQMAHKDPEILKLGGPHDDKPRPDNEEMLAIEFDNFIKEKSKKLSQQFKPFQIKMKALKINEYFSLKVLDQATVYLIYRDGSTNLKLNIGMILDHREIVDTDTAEVGEVSNSLERFPARTDSLAGLQKSVAHAARVERARVERAQRLRPAQPSVSADRLTTGLSRPRPPAAPEHCPCRCRKPLTTNLYYDTRLI